MSDLETLLADIQTLCAEMARLLGEQRTLLIRMTDNSPLADDYFADQAAAKEMLARIDALLAKHGEGK